MSDLGFKILELHTSRSEFTVLLADEEKSQRIIAQHFEKLWETIYGNPILGYSSERNCPHIDSSVAVKGFYLIESVGGALVAMRKVINIGTPELDEVKEILERHNKRGIDFSNYLNKLNNIRYS